MCKVNLDRYKGRDWQKYSHTRVFNTPLTSMDRSSRQKINKETAAINDTLDWVDLIYIFTLFHPKATENTSAHRKFSMIDHVRIQ